MGPSPYSHALGCAPAQAYQQQMPSPVPNPHFATPTSTYVPFDGRFAGQAFPSSQQHPPPQAQLYQPQFAGQPIYAHADTRVIASLTEENAAVRAELAAVTRTLAVLQGAQQQPVQVLAATQPPPQAPAPAPPQLPQPQGPAGDAAALSFAATLAAVQGAVASGNGDDAYEGSGEEGDDEAEGAAGERPAQDEVPERPPRPAVPDPQMAQLVSSLSSLEAHASRAPAILAHIVDLLSREPKEKDSSSSMRFPKVFDTKFNTSETIEYKITLEHATWHDELQAFNGYVATLDDSLTTLTGMTYVEFYAYMDALYLGGKSESFEFKLMDKADTFSGRQLMLCLDKDNPRVKNFKRTLRESTAKQRGSYMHVMRRMHDFMRTTTAPEVEQVKARYKNGIFFWSGQTLDESVLGVNECYDAFMANPYREQLPYCDLTAVIAKIPASGRSRALESAISGYENKILNFQLNPHLPHTLDLPLALRTLAHLWASSEAAPTTRPPSNSRNTWPRRRRPDSAHASVDAAAGEDAPWYGSECCKSGVCQEICAADVAAAWADYGPEANATEAAQKMCWGCGKDTPASHPLHACATTCKDCNLDFCPGNAGGKCAALAGAPRLTKQSVVLNASGKSISERMLDILIQVQRDGKPSPPRGPRGPLRNARQAAAAAIESFAAEHGIDPQQLLCELSADSGEIARDEYLMVGGNLETSAPSPESLLTVRPPVSVSPAVAASALDSNVASTLESANLGELKLTSNSGLSPAVAASALVSNVASTLESANLGELKLTSNSGSLRKGHVMSKQRRDVRRSNDSRPGIWIVAMLDSGTNCTAAKLESCARYAEPGSVEQLEGVSIGSQGVGQSTPVTMRCTLPIEFENGTSIPIDNSYDSPSSKKFLLDQNWLFYKHGLTVCLRTKTLTGFKDGSSVPLFHRGDHRLWLKFFLPVTDDSIAPSSIETTFSGQQPAELESNLTECDVFDPTACPELECAGASVLTTLAVLTYAARYNVSAQGFENLASTCDNLPRVKLTPETRRIIDADVHRRASIIKRASAPQVSASRPTKPGHTLAFDGKGPYEAPSVVGNHTYDMICVDGATSEPWLEGTIKHQGPDWHRFASTNVRRHRARGNDVYFLRFDRAGEFTSPEFIQGIERDLNVTVQLAPSKWHEGVAGPECNNDILTRMAECMCARAGLGPRYFSAARKHAAYLLRLRPRRGDLKSRREMAGGPRPDVKNEPTYIFGCNVLVMREKADRGPYGSLERGRTYEARYLGRDGAGHVVEKLDTGAVLYPSHCTPLNECELVRDSMPAAGALHSVTSQTSALAAGSHAPALAAPAPSKVSKLAQDAYPIGTRLEVSYKIEGKPTWFAATVRKALPQGQRHVYMLAWDDERWNSDAEWADKPIDLQRADGPTHRLASPLPSSVEPLAPIGANESSRVPNGDGMVVSLPFGGLSTVIDNISERITLRYPLAKVDILDAKNDPVNDDVTLRDVRKRYYAYLKSGNVTSVFIATPCGSYTHCSGRRLRGKHKSEITGLSGLSAEDASYLKRHNIFYEFTINVLEYCEEHNIPHGVECSPDRSDQSTDAFWPKYAKWGTFWDHPRVQAWIKRSGAKRYLVARCRTEEPITAQKYYQ